MRNYLSQLQAICILTLFTIATAIITGDAKLAEENAWLSIIIAAAASLPLYLVFAGLLTAHRGKNIYEICEIVLGKYFGKAVGAILTCNGIYLSAILIRKVSEFMSISGLMETPLLFIMLMIAMVSVYVLKQGIGLFGKWCQFYFSAIIIIFLVEVVFLTPQRDFDKLYPILYHGFDPVIKGAVVAFGFPMAQSAHLLSFFNQADPKVSYKKVFLYGWLISTVILLISCIDNITVLGPHLYSNAYYPDYMIYRIMSIGQMIKKVESFMVLSYLIFGFAKLTSTLFSVVIGVQKVFDHKTYNGLIYPIVFLCTILGFLAYENLIEGEFIINTIYVPYSIALNGILPIMIFMIYKIKSKLLHT